MNYQKLAKVLLRVASVWLLVAEAPRFAVSTFFFITQLPQATGRAVLWNGPIAGVLTIVLSIILFAASDRIAKAIAEEQSE